MIKTITINGSSKYDVLIAAEPLSGIGRLIREKVGGSRACIITDDNVAAIYLDALIESLELSSYEVMSLSLPPGDNSKSFDNYSSIVTLLSQNDYSRSDLVISFGGGMVGDIAGFSASSFKRGTKLVHIPTTLLAAVDSSVGGKTAINLPAAKNQVGSYYNPSLVLIYPELLHTLPIEVLQDAYAEIIKYGILAGEQILLELDAVLADSDRLDFTQVIELAINIKKSYIEADETDSSMRQFLNLGHLIGHAIEAASSYAVPHGQAVACGLRIEALACSHAGLIPSESYSRIVDILNHFGLDTSCSYSLDALSPFLAKDKRHFNGIINIIVPSDIGNCSLHALPSEDILQFVSTAL